jgi:hypothetical protein
MFTYGCFALLLFALIKVEEGHGSWIWCLPPLFVLWPNLHGGFLAGVGVVLIWVMVYGARLVLRPAERTAIDPRPWTALTAVAFSGLGTLVNPYGPELVDFLLKTATGTRPEIMEWQPTEFLSLDGAGYLLLLTASILALIHCRHTNRPFALLAFAILAILPLIARRHLALFALGVIFLAGKAIAETWDHWLMAHRIHQASVAGHRIFGPLLLAVFLIGVFVFTARALPQLGCIRVNPDKFPVRAVAFLKNARVSGNMAGEFDWGQYVIWNLGPSIRVSLDGRRETA